jgi:D-glycero-D-manno-heptose 1,7-bisphosphate phosphatase
VFLDRDGTLVPDARHPVRPEQLRLYASAGDALRRLAAAGAELLVVSNQSAVARGLLNEDGLRLLDRRLRWLIRGEGVELARTDYCPHHPEFTGPCACRKPEPGLILRGLRGRRLSPERCVLVGDTAADMRAARSAGVRGVLVLTGHGRAARDEVERRKLASAVAGNLSAAARWILDQGRPWER